MKPALLLPSTKSTNLQSTQQSTTFALSAPAKLAVCELPFGYISNDSVGATSDAGGTSTNDPNSQSNNTRVSDCLVDCVKVAVCELPFGYISSDSVGSAGGTSTNLQSNNKRVSDCLFDC